MKNQKKLWQVISGEGEVGTVKYKYATEIGIKRILTRERCGGDRWAGAWEGTFVNGRFERFSD